MLSYRAFINIPITCFTNLFLTLVFRGRTSQMLLLSLCFFMLSYRAFTNIHITCFTNLFHTLPFRDSTSHMFLLSICFLWLSYGGFTGIHITCFANIFRALLYRDRTSYMFLLTVCFYLLNLSCLRQIHIPCVSNFFLILRSSSFIRLIYLEFFFTLVICFLGSFPSKRHYILRIFISHRIHLLRNFNLLASLSLCFCFFLFSKNNFCLTLCFFSDTAFLHFICC